MSARRHADGAVARRPCGLRPAGRRSRVGHDEYRHRVHRVGVHRRTSVPACVRDVTRRSAPRDSLRCGGHAACRVAPVPLVVSGVTRAGFRETAVLRRGAIVSGRTQHGPDDNRTVGSDSERVPGALRHGPSFRCSPQLARPARRAGGRPRDVVARLPDVKQTIIAAGSRSADPASGPALRPSPDGRRRRSPRPARRPTSRPAHVRIGPPSSRPAPRG